MQLQRAMAKEAEAARDARAKVGGGKGNNIQHVLTSCWLYQFMLMGFLSENFLNILNLGKILLWRTLLNNHSVENFSVGK